MAVSMEEVFRQRFPTQENEIFSPSEENNNKILTDLGDRLMAAQQKYESNMKTPNEAVMSRVMTE